MMHLIACVLVLILLECTYHKQVLGTPDTVPYLQSCGGIFTRAPTPAQYPEHHGAAMAQLSAESTLYFKDNVNYFKFSGLYIIPGAEACGPNERRSGVISYRAGCRISKICKSAQCCKECLDIITIKLILRICPDKRNGSVYAPDCFARFSEDDISTTSEVYDAPQWPPPLSPFRI